MMNTVLWIVQGIVALMFLMAGFMKLSKSKDDLLAQGDTMRWVEGVSNSQLKMIGLVEVMAALGLILPQWLGILPILTPIAAIGLILTMIGAMTLHLRKGDGSKAIMTSAMLLLMAAFVAFGRFVLIPV